jgi:hypothetical protein
MMHLKLRAVVLAGLTALLLMGGMPMSPASANRAHLKTTYSGLYHAVADRHGRRAPGRNIRKWGVRTTHGTRAATDAELARSIRTFRRWLAPPIPVASATDATPHSLTSAQPQNAGGKWAIPGYIVACESGGDYNARNPSGARGAYQLMPGTYAAYGGDGSWSPADQDRVAARLYAAEGSSPWVCG